MRKIEENMLAAIDARANWKQANTEVVIDGLDTLVYLHGNQIACIGRLSGRVGLSSAGWETVTTKSRLNAIANHFNVMGVYQRKGVWYFEDGQPFSDWQTQVAA